MIFSLYREYLKILNNGCLLYLTEKKEEGETLTLTEWRRRQQSDLQSIIQAIQSDAEVIRDKCVTMTNKITMQNPGLVKVNKIYYDS